MTFDEEIKLEKYKAKIANELEYYRQQQARIDRSDRAAIDISVAALKMLILANGAAAIAGLTFVGNNSSSTHYLKISNIIIGIELFCFGVAFAILSAGLGYIYQSVVTAFLDECSRTPAKAPQTPRANKLESRSKILIWAALIAAFGSLIFFIVGIEFAATLN